MATNVEASASKEIKKELEGTVMPILRHLLLRYTLQM